MALNITIGGASADSYVTLAEYATYATAQGWTLSTTDAVNEAYLRRAALSINISYAFQGYRQYQTQAMQWPRVWTGLVNGWPINPDTIPQDIKTAQMELAYAIQGGADPLPVSAGAVKVERVKAGPVESETEYFASGEVSRFVAVDRILAPYCTSGAGQVRAVRG